MPPYLAVPHFPLSKLPITTKVALTIFAFSLFSGIFFVGVVLFAERTGWTAEGAAMNYGGSERYAEETGVIAEELVVELPKREIYDIIHPHSFLMPVIFFILCHLMEMSFGPKWLKLTLYIGSGVGMLVVIFAPLLIFASLPMAVILAPAVGVMLLGFAVMIVMPVIQMWKPVASSQEPVVSSQ